MTLEVIKSSEIEGEILDPGEVRSSIARRLGIDIGGLHRRIATLKVLWRWLWMQLKN